MRTLTLTEYRPSQPFALTDDELKTLLQVSSLKLEPTADKGRFVITPGSDVGVIELPELSISIEPKLPIERVLFLISYSLDPVRWSDDANFPTRHGLIEWLVPVFVAQARRAFSRGLVQGYRIEEDALTTIRGRIRFDDQLRRRFGQTPPAEVRFDEYTEDIDLNRIIKAAVRRLERMRLRAEQSRRSLAQLDVALERVQALEFSPGAIPDVHFTRLNGHCRQVFALSRLVLMSSALTIGHGSTRASAFLVDMNRVFEDFVVVALREALRVSDREFPQGASGRSLRLAHPNRITLRPDISWWHERECVFVGDVKYKRLDVAGYRHADLYQLLAYTVAADLPGGILVYAKGERPSSHYRIHNSDKVLEVLTLSLDGDPEEVLAEVAGVARRVRQLRATALRRTRDVNHQRAAS